MVEKGDDSVTASKLDLMREELLGRFKELVKSKMTAPLDECITVAEVMEFLRAKTHFCFADSFYLLFELVDKDKGEDVLRDVLDSAEWPDEDC